MKNGSAAQQEPKIEPIKLTVAGKQRVFDIDDPNLPDWVKDNEISADGYPYDEKLKRKEYEDELQTLQIELVKLQAWLQATGERVMSLFEGRDAAGKGGTIFVIRQYLSPRSARNVALPKPTDTELGQWYFQRYVAQFPTSREFVTFDRSWYNRAGVEPIMGFCTSDQYESFLDHVPQFELSIVRDGIRFFKFYLDIGQETQLARFHDRRHSKLTNWKFSPIDVAGMAKFEEYSQKRDRMLERTHTLYAPWNVVRANDKRRARLAVMRRLLREVPYEGKDDKAIGNEDLKIICQAREFLESQ